MKKISFLQVIVLLSFLMMVLFNSLANIIPLNNQTTGEISDSFEIFFVPAGYVFSIWGLIYLGLAAYVIYQFRKTNKKLNQIAVLFILSSLANTVWIFLWHYNYPTLSLMAMLTLLVSLVGIYQRLEIGLSKAKTDWFWNVQAPFSLYLGWISVATIANAAVFLYVLGWDGFGLEPKLWSVIMMFVAVILAVLMLVRRRDYIYAGVIVWALFGIFIRFQTDSLLALAAIATTFLVIISGILVYFLKPKS